MKTFIIIVTFAAFLQSTVIELDLVLIILICRSYVKAEKENLYLAFAFGILVSHLNLTYLGVRSILYLILIQITQVLSNSRLAGNLLVIIPLTFLLLLANQTSSYLLNEQNFEVFPKLFIESVLSLPVLYLTKLWEERFIVRSEIKLKI